MIKADLPNSDGLCAGTFHLLALRADPSGGDGASTSHVLHLDGEVVVLHQGVRALPVEVVVAAVESGVVRVA